MNYDEFFADAIGRLWRERRTWEKRPLPARLGACVYRNLKLDLSGDEVRPGWRVN
jgi:hypothetical protein